MPSFKDLTGNVYGELTVIEMLRNHNNSGRTYCKCVGIDDNEYIIRADALQSGATKYIKGACSSGKPEDITNQRFGKLVALYPTNKRAANSSIIWACKCDCGNETTTTASNLKSFHTTSCGCKKRSIAEWYIVRHLNKIGSIFETEKTFDGLRNPQNTMNLYFDFYFPNQKTVIEYDGELHYYPIKFFGGEERYNHLKECDALKNKFCEEHGITMVRIPYTLKSEEVIQIIDNIICP